MRLYDVYLNSSYMGEVKAHNPLSALKSAVKGYAAKGGDIRGIEKATVKHDNNAWYYTTIMSRGELKYTHVG